MGTENPAKAGELIQLLQEVPFEIVMPREVGIGLNVEETGQTQEENARLKAMAYHRASGLVTLADDSGLEVDALFGAPGVRSKRFAGEHASDGERIAFLLEKLKDVAWEKRTARFRCVMAIADLKGRVYLCEGECPGLIAFEPRGTGGFGYDPVFYLPECGKTMAELSPEEKNRISHRARAAEKARGVLKEIAAGIAN